MDLTALKNYDAMVRGGINSNDLPIDIFKDVSGDLMLLPGHSWPLNLPGAQDVFARKQLSSGTETVYTVPTGKKFLPLQFIYSNQSGGGVTPVWYKTDSAARRVTLTSSISSGGSSGLTPGFVYDEGEIVACNGAANCHAYIHGILCDKTAPIDSYEANDLGTTAVKLYEVPTGKKAILLNRQLSGQAPIGGGTGIYLAFFNESGLAVTFSVYLVAPGESVGTSTLITAVSVNNANQHATSPLLDRLPAGYAVYVVSSSATAGQRAYLTVAEVDA